jgi:hypothetical protein
MNLINKKEKGSCTRDITTIAEISKFNVQLAHCRRKGKRKSLEQPAVTSL